MVPAGYTTAAASSQSTLIPTIAPGTRRVEHFESFPFSGLAVFRHSFKVLITRVYLCNAATYPSQPSPNPDTPFTVLIGGAPLHQEATGGSQHLLPIPRRRRPRTARFCPRRNDRAADRVAGDVASIHDGSVQEARSGSGGRGWGAGEPQGDKHVHRGGASHTGGRQAVGEYDSMGPRFRKSPKGRRFGGRYATNLDDIYYIINDAERRDLHYYPICHSLCSHAHSLLKVGVSAAAVRFQVLA